MQGFLFHSFYRHCHAPDFLSLHRKLLSYLLIPVIQRQLDVFQETVWNSHRNRTQKNTVLPDGVPDHIYNFPEEYGLEECGKHAFTYWMLLFFFPFLQWDGVGWGAGGDGYSMTYHIFFDCYRIPSHRGTVERCCSTLRGFRNWWWFHWIWVQDQMCQNYTHARWAPCRTSRMRWSIQVFKKKILPNCLTNSILSLIHT